MLITAVYAAVRNPTMIRCRRTPSRVGLNPRIRWRSDIERAIEMKTSAAAELHSQTASAAK